MELIVVSAVFESFLVGFDVGQTRCSKGGDLWIFVSCEGLMAGGCFFGGRTGGAVILTIINISNPHLTSLLLEQD